MDVDDLIGHTIAGRYEVQAKIGAGGMGAVFLATHGALDQKVALKVLVHRSSEKLDRKHAEERFKIEAVAASKLQHPHIVAIHDFGVTDDGMMYQVMEFLQGRDLRTALRAEKPFPWERTVPIVEDISRALTLAHVEGIIHRDLKPENVFLVEGGRPDFAKILDFGVAKQTERQDFKALTQTGMLIGSPSYISPEQIRAQPVSASDIYSLGVVWYEMLTGHKPFVAEGPVDLLWKHLDDAPPPFADITDAEIDVPPEIEAQIMRMLAKDAGDRPTAEELLVFVDGLIERSGSSTPAPAANPALAEATLSESEADATDPDPSKTVIDDEHPGLAELRDDVRKKAENEAPTAGEVFATSSPSAPNEPTVAARSGSGSKSGPKPSPPEREATVETPPPHIAPGSGEEPAATRSMKRKQKSSSIHEEATVLGPSPLSDAEIDDGAEADETRTLSSDFDVPNTDITEAPELEEEVRALVEEDDEEIHDEPTQIAQVPSRSETLSGDAETERVRGSPQGPALGSFDGPPSLAEKLGVPQAVLITVGVVVALGLVTAGAATGLLLTRKNIAAPTPVAISTSDVPNPVPVAPGEIAKDTEADGGTVGTAPRQKRTRVEIGTLPVAEVSIDGRKRRRSTPLTGRAAPLLSPGKHRLVLRSVEDETRYVYRLDVPEGGGKSTVFIRLGERTRVSAGRVKIRAVD